VLGDAEAQLVAHGTGMHGGPDAGIEHVHGATLALGAEIIEIEITIAAEARIDVHRAAAAAVRKRQAVVGIDVLALPAQLPAPVVETPRQARRTRGRTALEGQRPGLRAEVQ